MSTSLSTRGFLHKRKMSEEEMEIQRRRPSAASGLQPVDRFREEVSDAQSREAGDGIDPEPLSMNSGNGDVQSKAGGGGNLDFPISTNARHVAKEPHSVIRGDGVVQREEAPSMSFFQGSSNFNINNSDFNQIHGNATIIRFGAQMANSQRFKGIWLTQYA
ncbi:hypothetical protein JOM56_001685 [Amanita muscaria]